MKSFDSEEEKKKEEDLYIQLSDASGSRFDQHSYCPL